MHTNILLPFQDGTIRLWDYLTGVELDSLACHSMLEADVDTDTRASAVGDGDTDTDRVTPGQDHGCAVTCVSMDTEDGLLAVGFYRYTH